MRILFTLTFVLPCTALLAELPGDPDLREDADLVNRLDVQKELEFVDDQVRAFKQNNAALTKAFRDKEKQQASLPPAARAQAALQWLDDVLEEKRRLRQEVLLPHQLTRLTELRWQHRAVNDPIKAFAGAVELTSSQKAKMRTKERELREELLKKMRNFHLRSQREILDVLTPEQRIQWQKAVGKEFKFQPSRPGLQILQRLTWGGDAKPKAPAQTKK